MKCVNCGKELKEGAKFCNSCGSEVEKNTSATSSAKVYTISSLLLNLFVITQVLHNIRVYFLL